MSDTKAAEKTINFKDDLVELKTRLADRAVIDKDAGVISLPEGVFFEVAPETVTKEVYSAVRHHDDLFAQAASLMAAEKSVELFKDNPKLKTVTLHADVWNKDTFSRAIHREGISRRPGAAEGTPYAGAMDTRKWGRVSTRTAAEEDNIKKHLKALALEAGLGAK